MQNSRVPQKVLNRPVKFLVVQSTLRMPTKRVTSRHSTRQVWIPLATQVKVLKSWFPKLEARMLMRLMQNSRAPQKVLNRPVKLAVVLSTQRMPMKRVT